jgi:hypothetical protein
MPTPHESAAAIHRLYVRRTTFRPVSLLILGSAGNGQTAYLEKINSFRSSLLVHFARIVRTHLGIATLHGHFFAHGLVFAFLHHGILGLFFTAFVFVTVFWAVK